MATVTTHRFRMTPDDSGNFKVDLSNESDISTKGELPKEIHHASGDMNCYATAFIYADYAILEVSQDLYDDPGFEELIWDIENNCNTVFTIYQRVS